MQKLLIVSSAFNEEDNVEQFVEEIKDNYEKFINNYDFNLKLELIIANNNSNDNTLKKLIELKQKYLFLRVFDNNANYGPDISLLNIFKNNIGDFNLILCSDLEDPPSLGFEMLEDLITNQELDACIGCKSDYKLNILNIFRRIYYIVTSFGARTKMVKGFHGFGVYKSRVIKNSNIYANRAYPDIRKSLLWSIVKFKKYNYLKRSRQKGVSSYTFFKYLKEGYSQLINTPSLSSRISIRVAFLAILLLIILMIFFFINFYIKIFDFPGGVTTILLITLFSSTLNYLLFALNAKQIEKIVLPNLLEIASSDEIK